MTERIWRRPGLTTLALALVLWAAIIAVIFAAGRVLSLW